MPHLLFCEASKKINTANCFLSIKITLAAPKKCILTPINESQRWTPTLEINIKKTSKGLQNTGRIEGWTYYSTTQGS